MTMDEMLVNALRSEIYSPSEVYIAAWRIEQLTKELGEIKASNVANLELVRQKDADKITWMRQCDKLQAEVEMLRGALEEVRDSGLLHGSTKGHDRLLRIVLTACIK